MLFSSAIQSMESINCAQSLRSCGYRIERDWSDTSMFYYSYADNLWTANMQMSKWTFASVYA